MEEVAELYERRWNTLDETARQDPFRNLLAESIECARALVGDPAGSRILDLGAGMGNDAIRFALMGATVYAIDLAASSIRIIQGQAKKAGLAKRLVAIRMDGEVLGFRDSTFDTVFLNAVLMHLNHMRVLREVYRVLRPGGRVVFHEPLGNNPLAVLGRRLSEFSATRPRYLKYEELRAAEGLFRRSRCLGFFLLMVLLMPLGTQFNGGSWVRRLYARGVQAEARLLSRVPWCQRFCWVLVGELVKSP